MLRRPHTSDPPGHEITALEIRHGGEVYRVTVKRTAAARRFTLRVKAATRDVVLTMPARARVADARTFAERHAGWIEARLRRLPSQTSFSPGEYVPLRGVLHEIAHRPATRGTVWIELPSGPSAEDRPPLLCVNAALSFVPRRVRDFLVREARRDLETAVARYARALGVRPRKMTLRDTTSRWGSCSSSGSLNFSWRLVMAPSFVLDYLAAHEVAHLVHMNHSAEFWNVVSRSCPDAGRAEAWLEAHGASLLRFSLEAGIGAEPRGSEAPAQPAAGALAAAAATSSRRLR